MKKSILSFAVLALLGAGIFIVSCKKEDKTVPVITLTGSSTVSDHELGTAFTDEGAKATDDVDGDLTSKITVTGTVDVTTAGTYTLTYNVSDAAGNAAAAVVRTIVVVIHRANYLGTYTVTDSGASGTYTVTITASATGADKIVLGQFGYMGCTSGSSTSYADVIATVSGADLTAASQSFCSTLPYTIGGSGSMNNKATTLTINYSGTKDVPPVNYTSTATMVKQ